MRRILPHPLLAAGLTFIWMLLTRFSLGHLLLGGVIAILAGLAFSRLEPVGPRLRSPWALIRLAGIVSIDIVRSNIAVARLILFGGDRQHRRHSAFVEIPLRLQDPMPLALLAMVITATPGTAWMEHDMDSGILLLHVFDMRDDADWQNLIRDRYESLLLEAFA